MMGYGNVHRYLLRSIAARGVLSVTEVEQILTSFTDEEISPVHVLVKEINDELRPLQQTIKITNDELTDEEVVVFISLGYDDATKAQNVFNATELEYYRVLIEQIMTTEARQITEEHAINLFRAMKSSLTKTQQQQDAQKLLNTWCRMRYLDKDENNYALGVRAIHEFEGYLRQNMPDTIEECCLCKQIVFRGCNCPTCSQAVHTRCLNKYLEKVDKWPCCKADFSAEQLEQLRCAEMFSQTQLLDLTQQTEENNTVVEQTQESTEDIQTTQDIIPEISQRINNRKRKRHCE